VDQLTTVNDGAVGKLEREDFIEEILALESTLIRQRCAVQPPPLLDFDVTMLQLKTLLILSSAAASADPNGLRVSDLARWLNVSAATASTLIDRLVDRGLVERREDPADRRQHRCRASSDGEVLTRKFFESTQAQSRELLAVLSDQELRGILEAVKTLTLAVERLRRVPIEDH
jgi:DNA-binding MarR family transcriptional regulator